MLKAVMPKTITIEEIEETFANHSSNNKRVLVNKISQSHFLKNLGSRTSRLHLQSRKVSQDIQTDNNQETSINQFQTILKPMNISTQNNLTIESSSAQLSSQRIHQQCFTFQDKNDPKTLQQKRESTLIQGQKKVIKSTLKNKSITHRITNHNHADALNNSNAQKLQDIKQNGLENLSLGDKVRLIQNISSARNNSNKMRRKNKNFIISEQPVLRSFEGQVSNQINQIRNKMISVSQRITPTKQIMSNQNEQRILKEIDQKFKPALNIKIQDVEQSKQLETARSVFNPNEIIGNSNRLLQIKSDFINSSQQQQTPDQELYLKYISYKNLVQDQSKQRN
eukprot:403355880